MLSHFLRARVQNTNVPVPTDPFFDQTTLLLHGDGTNGAQNNTFVSTPTSPYSYYVGLNGTNQFLTATSATGAFGFGTGNFTIEFWYYITSAPNKFFCDFRTAYPQDAPAVYTDGSGNLIYLVGASTLINGGTPPLNVWTHVAVARSGTSTKMFVNGIQVGSTLSDSTNYVDNSIVRIGKNETAVFMQGNISNVRIVKGTAVYTANFVPPTAPLTAISGTSLLTCQSPTIVDNSSNGFPITNNGNATVTSTISPTGGISGNPVNWYGTFNGSFQYLTAPYISGFNVGTGNFTLECWVYLTSVSGIRGICGTNPNYASGGVGFYVDNGVVTGQVLANSPAADTVVGPSTISANTWYHLALVRSSGTLTLYVNGVAGTSVSSSINPNNTSVFWLGTYSGTGYQLTGRLSNVRFVVGTAVYTANFTPPQGTIPSITNTQLLALQSGAIVDSSPNIAAITNNGSVAMTPGYWQLTRNGNTTQGSFSPFSNAAGAWSNYFPNGGLLTTQTSTSLAFGSGNFTAECWYYRQATTSNPQIISGQNYDSAGWWSISSVNTFAGWIKNFNAGSPIVTGTTTIVSGVWYHVAFVRDGNTFRLFVNGIQEASATYTGSVDDGAARYITIGGEAAGTTVDGYISNIRIVKGTAVYTAAFTPPTSPLTAITNTSLLTCQSNRFVDNSANNFTITRNGDVQVRPFGPFNPTSAYSTTTVGGSAYFDGSGDYLTAANSNEFLFGSGNFTVECWVYSINPSNADAICGVWSGSFSTSSWLLTFGNGDVSKIRFGVGVGGGGSFVESSTGAIIKTQWTHIAVTRSGNTLYMFANGVQVYNASFTSTPNDVTTNFSVAAVANGDNDPNCYLSDVRIVKGTAVYTANFTPPTAPLTPITNTSLLLNFTNAGIFDNTARNDLETRGNAQISTSVKKYGTGSIHLSNDSNYLTFPNQNLYFGTGNLTVEFWLYYNNAAPQFAGFLDNGGQGIYLSYGNVVSNLLFYGVNAQTSNAGFPHGMTNGTWNHVAFVRNGTTCTIYVNGTSIGSYTGITGSFSPASGTVAYIGQFSGSFTFSPQTYIDDYRITNGIARYTANFTPPAAAFPDL